MRIVRERDSGRVRASIRAVLPAVVALVLFVGASTLVGGLLGAGMATATAGLVFVLLAFNSALYAALTAGALRGAAWLDRRPWRAFGFHVDRRWLRNVVAGGAISLVAVGVSVGYGQFRGFRAVDLGAAGVSGPGGSLVVGLVVVGFLVMSLLGNVFEEVLYRGIMLRNFVDGLTARGQSLRVAAAIATLAGTVLFGLYHVPLRGNVVVAVDAAVVGITFSLAYLLTGELGLALGVHAGRFPLNVLPGATLGPFEFHQVLTFSQNTLAANLEIKLVRLGLTCLLLLGWCSLFDGGVRVARSLRRE
ncbi:CPBP family intramembrane glutamic endopeptidase [Halolamina salifodinae]|uniref:Membrane protease YdiL (CAAX protease family) n=1 Tax=Halolamina salifodinae TaxID=1202767 RepID=A0A8T4GZH6_9EURY|nr:CPBP family intramembrane glutamic endopeptidase [Halolamina salifodinae]MBP1988391.1 membrane protease YdiL (CAAX protease family) [Halolamina salifodinae]